jgi:F-type H+-transporting ATPase subunit delta
MQTQSVARPYAQALLGLARDGDRIADFGAQIEALVALLYGEPQMRNFLESPALEAGDKKRVLEAALRGQVDDLLVNFVCLLVDHRRVATLPAIAETYRDLADAAQSRARVRATTAVPLPDDLRDRLVALVEQKLKRECVLETEVQPDLLGGLVLTIGDKVYDGSVRSQLRRLRKEMMRSSGYED